MARTKALFHPGASEDYDAAYAWYLTHGIGIANDFEREIERCLRLIEEGPLRWPRYDAQRRRMIARKFPYSIVYEIINEQITVLAVAHARRRPYYWRERIGEI